MPYQPKRVHKKATKKSYKKKNTLVAKIPNKRIFDMVTFGNGFPRKMMMTHRYVEQVVSSATGVSDAKQWSCNGMFDPNITGVGHQPYYFDQCTALYDHYVVVGSKIELKLFPKTVLTTPLNVALWVNDDTTTIEFNPLLNGEYPESSVVTLPAGSGGKDSIVTLRSKWSAKYIFGKSVLANDELQGTNSTNPAEQSYYTVHVRSIDGVSTVEFYVRVLITYCAVWKELRDQPAS